MQKEVKVSEFHTNKTSMNQSRGNKIHIEQLRALILHMLPIKPILFLTGTPQTSNTL